MARQTKTNATPETEKPAEITTALQADDKAAPMDQEPVATEAQAGQPDQPAIQSAEQVNASPASVQADVFEGVECAVLYDSIYGKHDDIITLPPEQAAAAAAAGYVDAHPNAIKALREQG